MLPAGLPVPDIAVAADGDGDMPLHIDDLLRYAVSIGASDLHLTANMPPTVRLHGALRPIEGRRPARPRHAARHDLRHPAPGQRERFEAEHELDTSHTIAGVGRFRVNVALQRGTVAVALRPIPHEIPEFDTLGLPESIRSFADLRRGLVLVTGPTGSGKSTTLASLIDIINRTKPLHIVTVEDPIEFLHAHKRSIISQREVGRTPTSFSEALRRVLRQDPDVILVGEMRDLETISTALTAAETGHLVFAHPAHPGRPVRRSTGSSTSSRPASRSRSGSSWPSSLQGVVTQQLVPDRRRHGSGRVLRGADLHPGHPEPDPGRQDPPDLFADADRWPVRHADDGPEPGAAGQAAAWSPRAWPSTGAGTKKTSATTCTGGSMSPAVKSADLGRLARRRDWRWH